MVFDFRRIGVVPDFWNAGIEDNFSEVDHVATGEIMPYMKRSDFSLTIEGDIGQLEGNPSAVPSRNLTGFIRVWRIYLVNENA